MDKEKKIEFINDILEIYKKHNLCLSHEDGQGAFMVVPFHDYFIDWLKAALDTNYKPVYKND